MAIESHHVWEAWHCGLLTDDERDQVLADLDATAEASGKRAPALEVEFELPGSAPKTIHISRAIPRHPTIRRDVQRELRLKLALADRTTRQEFTLGEIATAHMAGEIDECEFRALTDLYQAQEPDPYHYDYEAAHRDASKERDQ